MKQFDYKTLCRKNHRRLNKLSTRLYDRIHNNISIDSTLNFKTLLIHLADAVDCGFVSPLDAYSAINQLELIGYLPIWIDCRQSNYSYLL